MLHILNKGHIQRDVSFVNFIDRYAEIQCMLSSTAWRRSWTYWIGKRCTENRKLSWCQLCRHWRRLILATPSLVLNIQENGQQFFNSDLVPACCGMCTRCTMHIVQPHNDNVECHPGGHCWDYCPGALYFKSSHCNSIEDRTPIDFMYGCPVFK